MAFDIFQLDESDYEEDEFYKYQDELLELFANSPEGQARAKEHPDMGFWARSLVDYGYNYTGTTLTLMVDDDVEELLTEVFPRKVSLNAPEDADDALPEMIAFWEYLKREHKLSNANHILSYLRSVKIEEFRKWMNDSSRFGMAKSIFTMGQSAGFDMTDEKDSSAFINVFNTGLLSRRNDLPLALGMGSDRESDLLFGLGIGGEKKKADPKAKRRRQIAKESRKRNRKRK